MRTLRMKLTPSFLRPVFTSLLVFSLLVTGCRSDEASPRKRLGPSSGVEGLQSGNNSATGSIAGEGTPDHNPAASTTPAAPVAPAVVQGGADPSGGEGEKSAPEELEANVEMAFAQLPALFRRIQYFLKDFEDFDGGIAGPVSFLSACYDQNEDSCEKDPGEVIEKIISRFKADPHYERKGCKGVSLHGVDEDTPKDMSITEELDLCISWELTRYPGEEGYIQVLALLAHEVAHGLGYGEDQADLLQTFVSDYRTIAKLPDRVQSSISTTKIHVSVKLRKLIEALTMPQQFPNEKEVCDSLFLVYEAFGHVIRPMIPGSGGEMLFRAPNQILSKMYQLYDHKLMPIQMAYCAHREKNIVDDRVEFVAGLLDFADGLPEITEAIVEYTKAPDQEPRLDSFLIETIWAKLLAIKHNEERGLGFMMTAQPDPSKLGPRNVSCTMSSTLSDEVVEESLTVDGIETYAKLPIASGLEVDSEQEKDEGFRPVSISLVKPNIAGELAISIGPDGDWNVGKVELIETNIERSTITASRYDNEILVGLLIPGSPVTANYKFVEEPEGRPIPEIVPEDQRQRNIELNDVEFSITCEAL